MAEKATLTIGDKIFDLPIRRAVPSGFGGLSDHVANPAYSTAVGLIRYAERHRPPDAHEGGNALMRVMGKLRTVFKEFF